MWRMCEKRLIIFDVFLLNALYRFVKKCGWFVRLLMAAATDKLTFCYYLCILEFHVKCKGQFAS